MNPMIRIRAIFRQRFAHTKDVRIAKLIGVTATTISRFRNGLWGSPSVAKYMADRYGGECMDLYKQSLTYKPPPAPRKSIQFPPPSKFVGMPSPAFETHRMPKLPGGVDSDGKPIPNIAYWLPK